MADKGAGRLEDAWAPSSRSARSRSARLDPHRRRNLRIAIRQLERAELYLVALYSLELADEGVAGAIDGLIRDVRALRQQLLRIKITA